ncbi:LD-carboxypeptidase [Gottschalkiaceae bacterium SANA]|nr:LD-carboxypeptidase [Gottschalkiaceae bacterium SANA]
MKLMKPSRLQKGDKVATISLSWGGAGDEEILWRYQQGKERLETIFGLEVVEMEHTLKGSDFIYAHPEKRAEDLMNAFKDPSIKAIIACIGGIESIRMLPYIDYDTIRQNPKIFMGYSDSTTTHMICRKAGISSIYGPTLLVDFAENLHMHDYTIEHIKRTWFSDSPIGDISPAKEWTSEFLPWVETNKNTARAYQPNQGYDLLQGTGIVHGYLLGGCLEVFDSLRGTALFPQAEAFNDAILFFETSEDKPPVWYVECALRTYGMMGIFDRINGMIWGKPMDQAHYEDYKEVIQKVLAEFDHTSLPVLTNMNFGHTEPKICLPYGAMAEINCNSISFSILDSAVR